MTRWPDDQMTILIKWSDDHMTRWLDNQMIRWADDQMTRRPEDQKTRWPDNQMTRWPDDHNDQMNILTRWPFWPMTWWQKDQMTRWQYWPYWSDDYFDQMTRWPYDRMISFTSHQNASPEPQKLAGHLPYQIQWWHMMIWPYWCIGISSKTTVTHCLQKRDQSPQNWHVISHTRYNDDIWW